MLPKWFQGNIFCAGLPIQNYSACHGDSGGPLTKFMDMENAHYEQIGKTLFCISADPIWHRWPDYFNHLNLIYRIDKLNLFWKPQRQRKNSSK